MLALTLLLAGGSGISFAQITGNPGVDAGWIEEQNSAASGVDLLGSGIFSANIYATAFTLAVGSPLVGISSVGSSSWSVGDTIVGVGGLFTATGNTSLTYNGNGSPTTRFVVKYGTSTANFSVGNASLDNGGNGAVLLGTYDDAGADVFTPSTPGLSLTVDAPTEYTGGIQVGITSGNFGAVMTAWNGTQLAGFESFMDLTILDAQFPSANVALGDEFVLDLQQSTSTSLYQDSLGTLPSAVVVPEPTTLTLLTAAMMLPLGARWARSLRTFRKG